MITADCSSKLCTQICEYRRHYGHNSRRISWHTLLFLLRNWAGDKHKYKRRGNTVNIGFMLCGGIGDVVMSGAYLDKFLQRVRQYNHTVYVFTQQPDAVIKTLFAKYPVIVRGICDDIIRRTPLDLLIKINVQFPEVLFSRDKYLANVAPWLVQYSDAVRRFCDLYPDSIERENVFSRYGVLFVHNRTRVDGIDILNMVGLVHTDVMQIDVHPEWMAVAKKFGLARGKFITFSNETGNMSSDTSVRLWPADYYEKLFQKIHSEFPDYKIVQLGTRGPDDIPGVDVNLVGKTSFGEMLALLKMSRLFIGAESGMVHLRHAISGGVSVVLFGPTPVDLYGYPENINIRSNACACRYCDGMVGRHWETFCAKTESPIAVCMRAITVKNVFAAVKNVLRKRDK